MAEEYQGQEKTEEATPRKKEKAREEGQTVRSRELNTMVLVTLGAAGLLIFVPWSAERMMLLTRRVFEQAASPEGRMLETLSMAAGDALTIIAPFLVTAFFAGLISSIAVGGLLFSMKAVRFKGERMDPLKGLKRMFSMKSLVELAKSIAKFVLVTGVSVLVLNQLLGELLNVGRLPLSSAIEQGMYMVGIALLLIGCALIFVAAIDVPFQMAEHAKQLKMTRQEVKDELKDSEGRPEVRARVRQLQQEIANRRMLDDVPEADVVITNPEHFAIAVRYDAAAMGAPLVVAKGVDFMALRIRETAAASSVPILESPPLARALYYAVALGGEVPEGLYMAVAQVLAYVYQLKAYRDGAGDVPYYQPARVPDDFAVDVDGEPEHGDL